MDLWIKICGNTSLKDAQRSVEAGADALGFVFAPSPRQVSVDEAAAIVAGLPEAVEKIGVFVGGNAEEIAAVARECNLTGVQLHFSAPLRLAADLRARLGREKKILRVMHFDSTNSGNTAGEEGTTSGDGTAELLYDQSVDALLVDSHSDKAVGGTGVAFDWIAASETLFRAAEAAKRRLVVAGGLNPENVAEALRVLRPWGVDVVSGVEASPGKKDPGKVRAFVEQVRAVEHDAWFRAKVQAALDDPRTAVASEQVKEDFAERRTTALWKGPK
jgi:phosphoribosylanthranilate isomerase